MVSGSDPSRSYRLFMELDLLPILELTVDIALDGILDETKECTRDWEET